MALHILFWIWFDYFSTNVSLSDWQAGVSHTNFVGAETWELMCGIPKNFINELGHKLVWIRFWCIMCNRYYVVFFIISKCVSCSLCDGIMPNVICDVLIMKTMLAQFWFWSLKSECYVCFSYQHYNSISFLLGRNSLHFLCLNLLI